MTNWNAAEAGNQNDPQVPLARNIAEVIDDLYRQHAPPRNHERMIELVQHQIEHAMRCGTSLSLPTSTFAGQVRPRVRPLPAP